jgi:putative transposase
MHIIQNEFYHIYNRGNNKQKIFFNDENYIYFTKKIGEQLAGCTHIICYCLMPNHFHIIIQANERSIQQRNSFGGKSMQELPYRIGILQSSYTQAINNQNNTSGSLFQQKSKAKTLSEQVNGKQLYYLENCFFYIHNNPLVAGLVSNLNDWQWSSYLDYAGVRNGGFCNKKLFLELTGLTGDDIVKYQGDYPDKELLKTFY